MSKLLASTRLQGLFVNPRLLWFYNVARTRRFYFESNSRTCCSLFRGLDAGVELHAAWCSVCLSIRFVSGIHSYGWNTSIWMNAVIACERISIRFNHTNASSDDICNTLQDTKEQWLHGQDSPLSRPGDGASAICWPVKKASATNTKI